MHASERVRKYQMSALRPEGIFRDHCGQIFEVLGRLRTMVRHRKKQWKDICSYKTLMCL